ncbi:MAG: aldo/keto reductase, partial [Chloroflexota bacterium]
QASYSATHGTLEYCRTHDIMIQAWSPVAGGRLFKTEGDIPDNERNVAIRIHELAEAHNTTTEAIALAWLLRHPAGIMPILGTMNPARIPNSVKADDVELSRIEWYRLLEAANGHAVP